MAERLPLYWFDNPRNKIMRADPDTAPGKVFKTPVEAGNIPVQDGMQILSVSRLRTGAEIHTYWTTYSGGLWASKSDVPDPTTATFLADGGAPSGLTTFGDLTGNGNEDLILLVPSSQGNGLATVATRENQGLAKLGPVFTTGVPSVLINSSDTTAGRGDHPFSSAPWVFGAQGTVRSPVIFLAEGKKDASKKVTFTSRGQVSVPGPPGAIPISAVSLGDSDGDGVPDLIICYFSHTTGKTSMGLVPCGPNPSTPFGPFKALPELGESNVGGVMF